MQVEKILDSRQRKGKTEYLIHWKDFEDKHNTWEPAANLEGCQDLLNKFNEKVDKDKVIFLMLIIVLCEIDCMVVQ